MATTSFKRPLSPTTEHLLDVKIFNRRLSYVDHSVKAHQEDGEIFICSTPSTRGDNIEMRLRREVSSVFKHAAYPSLFRGTITYTFNGEEKPDLDQKEIRVITGGANADAYSFIFEGEGINGVLLNEHSFLLSDYELNPFVRGNRNLEVSPKRRSEIFSEVYLDDSKTGALKKLSTAHEITMKGGSTYPISVRCSSQAAVFDSSSKDLPPFFMRVESIHEKTEVHTIAMGHFQHNVAQNPAYIPIQIIQAPNGTLIVRSEGDPSQEPIVYCKLALKDAPSEFPETLTPWQKLRDLPMHFRPNYGAFQAALDEPAQSESNP